MQFTVDPNHASLPGHFPGHPVVPGVVILNYVFDQLSAQHRIRGIRRLKFLQPVLPGQALRLELGPPGAAKLPFKVWRGDELVADGQALLDE